MNRERFPFTAEQLELLLAFEKSNGLKELAEVLAKDASVVSRNLQRLGDEHAVITKHAGKWRITELGRQVNLSSKNYLMELERILPRKNSNIERKNCFGPNALLMVINAQKGLQDPTLGPRNNSNAEQQLVKLLQNWRENKKPVVHIKHVSDTPSSLFFREAEGAKFMPLLSPAAGETVFEKTKASAFTLTKLAEYLEEKGFDTLILAGFTAGECIDSTARQASELGFTTYVVSDATATFDLRGADGTLHKADKVHKLVLANLHTFFAEIIDTDFLLHA